MKAQHVKKARAARLLSLCFFWAATILLLQSCADPSEPVTVLNGETMGTYYQIKIVNPGPELSVAQLQKITDDALVDINNKMSTYIPDSELMRLNKSEPNQWVEVSVPLYDVLEISDRISELTEGAFDITVAPLVNLWGFGPEGFTKKPDELHLQKVMEQIGYQYLELQPDTKAVRRLKDIQLDLSAVAKGYGADFLAELYQNQGLRNFMVEIGGELRVAGHNPQGKPWRIGVETPSLTRSGVMQAVEVSDVGMATSGDYRNYYEVDGVRISHTIDPATGHPVSHTLAAVTVITDTAAEADALATALNVMGAERGLALAEAEGIAAYFIERQNDEFVVSYSEAFKAYLPD